MMKKTLSALVLSAFAVTAFANPADEGQPMAEPQQQMAEPQQQMAPGQMTVPTSEAEIQQYAHEAVQRSLNEPAPAVKKGKKTTKKKATARKGAAKKRAKR